MARILYLHGSKAGPFGNKTAFLEHLGHEIVARPRLPYPNHPRRSWRWLKAYFCQHWFEEAVAVAQDCVTTCCPDVLVGSSMGGAVAMNLVSSDLPQVLISPAWAAWSLLRFGKARNIKPATVLIHGDQDWMVFSRYSRYLSTQQRVNPGQVEWISSLERGMCEKLNDCNLYSIVGRLILVHGEGHRCNSLAALRALEVGIEGLIKLHQK